MFKIRDIVRIKPDHLASMSKAAQEHFSGNLVVVSVNDDEVMVSGNLSHATDRMTLYAHHLKKV